MSITLRSISDTYVSQSKSSTNYVDAPRLGMRTGGSGNAYALLRPSGLPVGSDVTIVSATLKVFNNATWSGSVTLTAKRVTSSYSASSVKYTTQPTVTTTSSAAVTKSGAVAGTEWDLDITAIAQTWASGTSNYGVRLEVTGTTALYIHAANASGANSAFKPVIEIVWSGSPETPTAMNPDSGRQVSLASPTITWAYSDPAGGTMKAYQLQMNTADVWTSPAYDSGVVTSSLPQHTLTTTVALATPMFYRVRQQNSAGKWSAYSATATFGRTAKGTLTLTNPAVSPNNFVTELTPPITWTFTGTETKWQVLTTAAARFADGSGFADSGEQSGTDLAYTSPAPIYFDPTTGLASVTLRVWDNVDRASTPGDLPYVEVTRTFTFAPGSITGGAVTSLAFVPDATLPFGKLTWSRATAPDSFTIVRDGVAVATDVAPGDLLVSGTSYAYSDPTASPRNTHTWRVDAVVNGVASTSSPTVTGTIEPVSVWLLDEDDPSWYIAIEGEDGTWSMGEESEMHEVRGSDRQVLITEALRGYEGTFSGRLLDGLSVLTAQELRDRVWDLKQNPTHTWRLVLADMNIPVVIRNATVTPSPEADLQYGLSFEFYQQGELQWTV